MDQQERETLVESLDDGALSFLTDLSALRAELAKKNAQIHELMDDNAQITARLEQAISARDQARIDLSASLAREQAAAAETGRLRGMMESAGRTLSADWRSRCGTGEELG